MKNVKNTKRSGFSLIELIIVIIIMGVLGAAISSNGFPVVKKASKNVESLNAKEVRSTLVSSFMDGTVSAFTATSRTKVNDALQSIPKSLQYRIVMKKTGSDSRAYLLATPENARDEDGISYIKEQVLNLDEDIDKTDGGSAGRLFYDDTCSRADGASTDCYYAYYLLGDGIGASGTWFERSDLSNTGDSSDDLTDDGITSVVLK